MAYHVHLKPMKMKYNKEQLLNQRLTLTRDDFVFFWGHEDRGKGLTKVCLSQWYQCPFVVEGQYYNCTEQYMMAEKARIFGDVAIRAKILAASDPSVIKKLGRLVSNFDAEVWDEKCIEVVYNGNLNKFGQNKKLKEYLLSTGKSTFVEASPYDKIWGVGKSVDEEDINIPHFWKGENRLGFILMEVRETLLSTVQKKYDQFGYSNR